MPNSFNENLSMFLTSCRESAIQELAQNNVEYKKLQLNTAEILRKVKNEIPSEYETLLDIMTDTMYTLARKEMNHLYFRGFKDCLSLYKRFNESFMESKEFERFFT